MSPRQRSVAVLLMVTFGFIDAQWPGYDSSPAETWGWTPAGDSFFMPRGPAPASARSDQIQFSAQPQNQWAVQQQQALRGPVKKLTWHFPAAPQLPTQPPVPFDLQHPAASHGVAVECGENSVYVEVKKDFFGTGELIEPMGLSLGGCSATGEDTTLQVLVFEAELQGCRSILHMTDDELVYAFTLTYSPVTVSSTGAPIVRSTAASVAIECHYPRLHNVSSNALLPVWIPYASTEVAEQLIIFFLKLMMNDWVAERPSNQYFMGDIVNIEASVMQFYHVPLRVFVDRCVATAAPDVTSVPKYSFIDNYGCMYDAKITGSRSHFMPQTQMDKLQFQLEAFMFQQQSSNLIYITCYLKATAASYPSDAEHKACSFTNNGWAAASGASQVCHCCDSTCATRKARDLSAEKDLYLEKVTLGPIVVDAKGSLS